MKPVNKRVTILMYHYVRDLKGSRYPRIKGLDAALFREQIRYIVRHYHVVGMRDVLAAVRAPAAGLPTRSILLTFDDGFTDHFETVLPVLLEHGIQGCFFPPGRPICEHIVLDVHKIHFILASVPDASVLVTDIFKLLDDHRRDFKLEENKVYFERYALPHVWDSKEVVFIKRLLQMGLPAHVRSLITDELFSRHVTSDEAAFAKTLYLNHDQLRALVRAGMVVGSHGWDHHWMDTLPEAVQQSEVNRSLDFLKEVGVSMQDWVMCYPYGQHNESLLNILKDTGCAIGLVDHGEITNLGTENPLTLSRIPTNFLPVDSEAPPNEWTLKG